MTNLSEKLEQLSAAATRARVLESRVDNRWQVTLDFGSDKDAMCQFSEAYRTGQLVAVPDDAIERVARAFAAVFWGRDWWDTMPPTYKESLISASTAAIAAMKDTQP